MRASVWNSRVTYQRSYGPETRALIFRLLYLKLDISSVVLQSIIEAWGVSAQSEHEHKGQSRFVSKKWNLCQIQYLLLVSQIQHRNWSLKLNTLHFLSYVAYRFALTNYPLDSCNANHYTWILCFPLFLKLLIFIVKP